MSRPANNLCNWSKLYVRDEMFKWKTLSPAKIFESTASLNSLMLKYVDEFGISESLSTLFSLSIRAFSLPKFLFVVHKSLIFFPRIVWWNSLLFGFTKGNLFLQHSTENHWVLSFLNKLYVWIYLVAFYVHPNVTNVTLDCPVVTGSSFCAYFTRKLDHLLNAFF